MSVPTPLPLMEAQARFVASHLAGGKASETTQAQREAWVQQRCVAVGERSQDLHFMSGDSWLYMKELTALSGVDGHTLEAYSKRVDTVATL